MNTRSPLRALAPPRPDSKQDEERSANGGGASWPAPPPPSSPSAALPEKVRLRRHSSRRWCRRCQQVPAAGGAGKRGQRPGEYCVIRIRKNKPIGDKCRFLYIGGGEIHALGRNASNLLASVQSGQNAPFFGFKIISRDTEKSLCAAQSKRNKRKDATRVELRALECLSPPSLPPSND